MTRTGGVAEGVDDPPVAVPAFPGEGERPVLLVELGAPVDQLLDLVRASRTTSSTTSRSHSPSPATSVSSDVVLEPVLGGEHAGDPRPGVGAIALGDAVLGDDEDVQVGGDFEGGPQPGDPGPDDEHVGESVEGVAGVERDEYGLGDMRRLERGVRPGVRVSVGKRGGLLGERPSAAGGLTGNHRRPDARRSPAETASLLRGLTFVAFSWNFFLAASNPGGATNVPPAFASAPDRLGRRRRDPCPVTSRSAVHRASGSPPSVRRLGRLAELREPIPPPLNKPVRSASFVSACFQIASSSRSFLNSSSCSSPPSAVAGVVRPSLSGRTEGRAAHSSHRPGSRPQKKFRRTRRR